MNVVVGASTFPEIKRISGILRKLTSPLILTATFRTMREGRKLLGNGAYPDLFVLETDLSDGKSFQFLNGGLKDVPVIFFSGSSDDAVRAFSTNAVGYLMKPVRPAALSRAIDKFLRTKDSVLRNEQTVDGSRGGHYRQRIIIRNGNRLQFRTVSEVALFYADGKSVYLVTRNGGRKFLIDHTLEELEGTLQPENFFRISRKHIVPVDCIAEVKGLISGKLAVKLNVGVDQELYVSRERASRFKRWLDR